MRTFSAAKPQTTLIGPYPMECHKVNTSDRGWEVSHKKISASKPNSNTYSIFPNIRQVLRKNLTISINHLTIYFACVYVSVAYALTVKESNIHYSYLNLSQLSILRKENFFFKKKKLLYVREEELQLYLMKNLPQMTKRVVNPIISHQVHK